MKIIDRKFITINENNFGAGDVKCYVEEFGYDIEEMTKQGDNTYVYLVLRADE